MRRSFQIVFLLFFFTSCSEDFDSINPTEFNKIIAQRTDIETSKQLIEIYYNYPENEETPKLIFYSKKIDNGLIEITLIHDDQKDDSQRATKIIITTVLKNKKWTVKGIKTNRKCWDGRGHTNWSMEWCS